MLGKPIAATDAASLVEASKDARVVSAVAAVLEPYARDAKLLKYEAVGDDIHLSMDPFTMENDLLTPTFKTKRNVAAVVYKSQLADLYNSTKRAVTKGFASKL